MFGEKEFKEVLSAYTRDKSGKSDHFYSLLKRNTYFVDIKSREEMEKQIESFMDLISNMNRDDYGNRYVLISFITEFCRYLDKDFLFNRKDRESFFFLKEKLKDFTGRIYELNKKFTQTVGSYSLEHLLEDYSVLIEFGSLEGAGQEEGGGMWPAGW